MKFMIRVLNKRGQFYLIAAIVLATVMVGLTTIINYSKTEPNFQIYDLKEEIQLESRNVFDYGLNEGYTSEVQFNALLIDFTQDYVDYYRDKDLYFVFGDKNNITISGSQKTSKIVSISDGSFSKTITNEAEEFTGSIDPEETAEKITLNIDDLQYNFPLNEGRNFYFVIFQETDGGEYIISG